MLGKTERRLALVILLTATIPLAAAVLLVNSLFARASLVWVNPDVEQQLNRGVDLYKDYVKVVKDDMKHQGDAIAADAALGEAAKAHDGAKVGAALALLATRYPSLLALDVTSLDGDAVAHWDRGRPLDEEHERKLPVPRPLAGGDEQLVATFAFDRRFELDLDRAGGVRDTYAQFDKLRDDLYSFYVRAFGELLGGTVLLTVTIGFFLARGFTRRINRLANAIDRVAAGDLDVRVPVTGSDEMTELASVFNRMLGEMQTSRARIEFLQRIGAWQEMAQRLAHEIKNPLTPIQLAVQECHRKYPGDDAKYRHLLDTTLEIVEEEVGTLRRLVGNFSSFARLPQAELEEADLRDFLRECSEQLGHFEDAIVSADASGESEAFGVQNVAVEWEIPTAPLPVAIDRQMLRRVFVNLVRNAVQAIRDARGNTGAPAEQIIGHVVVTAKVEGDGVAITVDDDGPGVPDDLRARVFDPYFTTKSDGTGLGLAIVKKVVVEHGGSIGCEKSARLGGARFVVRLPGPHSAAISAARERPSLPRPSSRALA
jgi:nitrogen fixation/metabolism regulation signal transduction histidine kinase